MKNGLKRWIWRMLVLALCLSAALAGAQSRSVDAVILMDMSTSMDTDKGNDPLHYRIDAAETFVGMLDMDGSRVAVIPFKRKVYDADTTFVSLNTDEARRAMFTKLETTIVNDAGYRNEANNGGAGTNQGQALMMALQMLHNRPDTENNPMILLLTDGKNDMGTPIRSGYIPVWNPETGVFDSYLETRNRVYSTADAETLTVESIDAAKTMGIPIYAVGLIGADSVDTAMLRRMAEETGGKYIPVHTASGSSSEAAQLPEYFASMLADQIDSSPNLQVSLERAADGTYYADLPILNHSVHEANIYIPLGGIRSVRLTDGDGRPADGQPGVKRLGSAKTGNSKTAGFYLYKLTDPQPGQNRYWRLTIEPASQDGFIADQVRFTILYNYDLTFGTTLEAGGLSMNPGEAMQISKGETLKVTSRFYDTAGRPSDDSALYVTDPVPNARWSTVIEANYQLQRIDNRGNAVLVKAGRLQSDPEGCLFGTEIDLKTANRSPDGTNGLKAGEYRLVVTASGAGLERESVTNLTVTNTPPRIAQGKEGLLRLKIDVEKPREQLTADHAYPVLIPLSEVIENADGDRITYELTRESGSDPDPVTLHIENGAIRGEIRRGPDGHYPDGEVRYKLSANDGDKGGTMDHAVEVKVVNMTAHFFDHYRIETSVEGAALQSGATEEDLVYEAKKGTTVRLRMRLIDRESGRADNSGVLTNDPDLFDGSRVSAVETRNLSMPIERFGQGAIRLDENDPDPAGSFVFEIPIDQNDTRQDWSVECAYRYNGMEAPEANGGKSRFRLLVTDEAPVLLSGADGQFLDQYTFGSLPGPLAALEQPTEAEALTIDLTKIFRDPDGEQLTYECRIVTKDGESAAGLMPYRIEGDRLILTPTAESLGFPGNLLPHAGRAADYEGSLKLSLIAKDHDQGSADFKVSFDTVSVRSRWLWRGLLLLAAIVAAILLIAVIHRARMPKFKGWLEIYRNAAINPSGSPYEFPPVKDPLRLHQCVDVTLADELGIPLTQLQKIVLKPRRGQGIQVSCQKTEPGMDIQIQSKAVTAKPVVFMPGEEMTLTNTATGSKIRIQYLTDSAIPPEPDPIQPWGEGGESGWDERPQVSFGEMDLGGAPAADEPPASEFGGGDNQGGNDGFAF